jgi:alkylation response protein AidB-like acyl-CoA dehydrogenase
MLIPMAPVQMPAFPPGPGIFGADLTAAHAKRARELGLYATNMPAELGGGGCTSLQQVLVQEQMGRVTNALGWVAATPPSWLPAVATLA